jgi:hypothetical protein
MRQKKSGFAGIAFTGKDLALFWKKRLATQPIA